MTWADRPEDECHSDGTGSRLHDRLCGGARLADDGEESVGRGAEQVSRVSPRARSPMSAVWSKMSKERGTGAQCTTAAEAGSGHEGIVDCQTPNGKCRLGDAVRGMVDGE